MLNTEQKAKVLSAEQKAKALSLAEPIVREELLPMLRIPDAKTSFEKHKAFVNNQDHITSIIKKVKNTFRSNQEAMRLFLDVQDPQTGLSMLHAICDDYGKGDNDRTFFAKFLLDEGANPNLQDVKGNTPMHTLMETFDVAMSQRHKWNRWSENSTDQRGAIENKLKTQILPTVAVLVAAGANPELSNKAGETPFEILSRSLNSLEVEATLAKKLDYSIKTLPKYFVAKCQKAEEIYNERGRKTFDGLPIGLGNEEDYATLKVLNGRENFKKYDKVQTVVWEKEGKGKDKVKEKYTPSKLSIDNSRTASTSSDDERSPNNSPDGSPVKSFAEKVKNDRKAARAAGKDNGCTIM